MLWHEKHEVWKGFVTCMCYSNMNSQVGVSAFPGSSVRVYEHKLFAFIRLVGSAIYTFNLVTQMIFQTSGVSIGNGNKKDSLGTSIFFKLNLMLKFFHATVAVVKIGSRKYYLQYLYHKLMKFEQKIEWSELQKIGTFWQKPSTLLTILNITLAPVWKQFL